MRLTWGWYEWSLVIRSMIWSIRWSIRNHDLKLNLEQLIRKSVASICPTWRIQTSCWVPDCSVFSPPVLSITVLPAAPSFLTLHGLSDPCLQEKTGLTTVLMTETRGEEGFSIDTVNTAVSVSTGCSNTAEAAGRRRHMMNSGIYQNHQC